MCYRNMLEQWKCFSVNNCRLIYDIQLVHLLACNTHWLFKMHGETIKTSGCIPDWGVTASKGISVTETSLKFLYFKDKQLPTVQGKPYQRRLVKLPYAGYWQSIANITCHYMSMYSELAWCNYYYILYIHTPTSQTCSNTKNLIYLMCGKRNFLPTPHPLPPDGSELLILLLDNTGATFHLE
jgi:hypothetical protein